MILFPYISYDRKSWIKKIHTNQEDLREREKEDFAYANSWFVEQIGAQKYVELQHGKMYIYQRSIKCQMNEQRFV